MASISLPFSAFVLYLFLQSSNLSSRRVLLSFIFCIKVFEAFDDSDDVELGGEPLTELGGELRGELRTEPLTELGGELRGELGGDEPSKFTISPLASPSGSKVALLYVLNIVSKLCLVSSLLDLDSYTS